MVSISKYAIDVHAQSLPKNLSISDILELRYVIDVENDETLYPRFVLTDLEISPSQFSNDIERLSLGKFRRR